MHIFRKKVMNSAELETVRVSRLPNDSHYLKGVDRNKRGGRWCTSETLIYSRRSMSLEILGQSYLFTNSAKIMVILVSGIKDLNQMSSKNKHEKYIATLTTMLPLLFLVSRAQLLSPVRQVHQSKLSPQDSVQGNQKQNFYPVQGEPFQERSSARRNRCKIFQNGYRIYRKVGGRFRLLLLEVTSTSGGGNRCSCGAALSSSFTRRRFWEECIDSSRFSHSVDAKLPKHLEKLGEPSRSASI